MATLYKVCEMATETEVEVRENGRKIDSYKATPKGRVEVELRKTSNNTISEEDVFDLVDKGWLVGKQGKPVTRIFGCYNYKGGIGKTALTAGLGMALAESGKKVLLIDADPQSSLSILFRGHKQWHEATEKKSSIWELYAPLGENKCAGIGNPDIINRIVIDTGGGFSKGMLHLLSGSLKVAQIESSLAFAVFDGRKQGGGIALQTSSIKVFFGIPNFAIKNKYDFVLFDAPPSFTLTTIAIMLIADDLVAPIDADLATFYGLRLLDDLTLDLIDKNELRPSARRENAIEAFSRCTYVVPSKYDERLGTETIEAIRDQWDFMKGQPHWKNILKAKFVEPGIPYSSDLADKLRSGAPLDIMKLPEFENFRKTSRAILGI